MPGGEGPAAPTSSHVHPLIPFLPGERRVLAATMDVSDVPGGSGGYELHQKLRTTTVRLLRKKKYDQAIETLSQGAAQLLDMQEEGSGCDLTEYLLDVYKQAETPVVDASRGMCAF